MRACRVPCPRDCTDKTCSERSFGRHQILHHRCIFACPRRQRQLAFFRAARAHFLPAPRAQRAHVSQSPQLLQCFDPLDGKACITQMMTHTMRVLRQVRCQGHMLLSTTHASCNPAMLTATHRQAVECDYSLHHLLHPCIVLRSVCICDCLTRLLCVCQHH